MHAMDGMYSCPAEYTDISTEEGADCEAMTYCAGACPCTGADDHDHSDMDSMDMAATHAIDWLAGFGDAAAQAMTAAVGDTLEFSWTGNHNVYLMADETAFDACDFTGAIDLGDASPVSYTLTSLPAYFGCEIAGHCTYGQKLAVTAE